MTGGDKHSQGAELKLWAHEARVRSAVRTVQAARAAESAAVIREQVGRMIYRVAERNPQYGGALRTISGNAARPHAGDDTCAAGGRRGWLPPELRNEPEATVVSGLEVYLRDMAVAQERARMARELQDKVIRRVFAAGLTPYCASGLTTQPEVRRRIEAAADELDQVIRVIRDALFNLPGPPASHEPGGG